MTIQEIENQIIEEFENFEDWMDKYNYIIEMGRECPSSLQNFQTLLLFGFQFLV